MTSQAWCFRLTRSVVSAATILLAITCLVLFTSANVSLTEISQDPFTNTTSQHKTEVEPDTFSSGSTIVAAFQAGRFFDGGASDVAFATSTDGGTTWTQGFLPGITKVLNTANPYDRVSDPSVAFDARHNVWLISSLAIVDVPGGISGAAVVVSRSTDGGQTWGTPVVVASASGNSDLDKNWTVCDNTPTSPFYGNCYTEFDDFGDGNRIKMSTSTDGGLTWGGPKNTANNGTGLGGQPVVQPDGTVIVPIANPFETAIFSFMSVDGGNSWSTTKLIAPVIDHTVAGNLRSGPLPSAAVDADGVVYVVWQDCRYRRGCRANDIVMSTSLDGRKWSRPVRIPIDAVNGTVDHFIPGLDADPATSGSNVHLALTYYFYPDAACNTSTCQLMVGFIASADGGATWGTATQVAGPMLLSWLPDTNQGRMVGDYISTSFSSGLARGVFAVANAPTAGGADCATAAPNCDQAMYTPSSGFSLAATTTVATPVDVEPVPDATSDHRAPQARSRRR